MLRWSSSFMRCGSQPSIRASPALTSMSSPFRWIGLRGSKSGPTDGVGMLSRLRVRYDKAGLQAKFALHVALSTALLFALLMPVVLYIQRRVVLTAVEENGFRMTDIFGRSSVQAVLADDYLVMQ